ncbi:MAG: MBOAT family protein [Lentisphaeria bacterium]|nr:MBOAT family protein [Lentisphaeria bacterium]
MIYSSFDYVFLFFPIMMILYFGVGRVLPYAGRLGILLAGSLYFYAYWMPVFLPLLFLTIILNFLYGRLLRKKKDKRLLILGIGIDLLPLLFFKYTNFVIQNINALAGLIQPEYKVAFLPLILPLGISFFTFQAIAYLVDCFQKDTEEYSLLEFSVFISFWPQLIAGPILHHSELIPQLRNGEKKHIHAGNVITGATVFVIGASKKLLLADSLAILPDQVFALPAAATPSEALVGTVCYTLQLYFDFSGYCDMAYGSAKIFNIELPFNFLSPYKSRNMKEFWQRWHITLSQWLRDYIYIPLGGSRKGEKRTFLNFLSTFLIGGIWHGAGWNFVVWGMIHGISAACCHLWHKRKKTMHWIIGIGITMLIVHTGWIFFRASSLPDAFLILSKIVEGGFDPLQTNLTKESCFTCIYSAFIVWSMPNSQKIADDISAGKHIWLWGMLSGILWVLVILYLIARELPPSPFLYFQF